MKKILLVLAIFTVVVTQANNGRFKQGNVNVDAEHVIDSVNYSAKIYVQFTDSLGVIPNFYSDTTVVSSNYQTGFEVDSVRNVAINELVDRVNGN